MILEGLLIVLSLILGKELSYYNFKQTLPLKQLFFILYEIP